MKKIIVMIAIMAMAMTVLAEFSAGFKFRSKMQMKNTWTGTSADTQYMNRFVNYRLRPYFGYKVNDMVSFKVMFEFGDTKFGTGGAAMGTDGKDVEIKHAYLNIVPNKTCNLRFGLQGYHDMHNLVIDKDLAGIKWDKKFGTVGVGIGWFAIADNGEGISYSNEETYSFGSTLVTADFGFAINDKMSAGLAAIVKLDSEQAGADSVAQNLATTGMWFAPTFKGDFGMVKAEAEFAYNMKSMAYTSLVDGLDDLDEPDAENGFAFSLKTKTNLNEKSMIGVDFIFSSGDDDLEDDDAIANGYESIGSYLTGPTKIMTEDAYDFFAGSETYGLMMPTLYFRYKLNKTVTLGGVFAYAMTMNEVGPDEATDIGMEFGVDGKLKLHDAVVVVPYASFFMPGVAYTGSDDADADMQMKFGITMKVKL